MNWICKFFIVLSCFVTFTLCSSPILLAASKSHVSAQKTTTTKKIVAQKTPRHRSKVVKRRSPSVPAKVIAANPSACPNQSVAPQRSRVVSLVGGGDTGALSQRITARSAMIMDAVSGDAIYAQASDNPAQPASTIKILTGVISLDALRKNELVEVSHRAAMMPKSKVYLNAGKKYPADDLINAVLLASANDASVALAEKIGGSEEVFAKLMTAKARSFGATNTVCKTANGLTASGQYTTAHDLAKIFNHAMRIDEFASKMAVTEVENTDGKIIKSHNRALWQVDGAEGGKTGYTDVARKTYVGKFKRDNDEIVVALMGSENMWGDLKKLVEYGFTKKHNEKTVKVPKEQSTEKSQLFAKVGKNRPQRLPLAETF
jgi:D-alanyl-D-alanine carboxypeptidase (penicillin-binding protein 5/6)